MMTEAAALGLRVDGIENIDKASSSLDRFKSSSDSAEKSSKGLSGESRKTTKSLSEAARESDRASSSLSRLSGAARLAGAVLGAAIGGLTFRRLISETTDFDSSMRQLQATSRATAEQMQALERQSRTLGATSIFSAKQAADAQNFLAMAGFSVNETLSATPGVLRLATAASMDLASAADIASNVLGGMRLEVDQLDRVIDVLAATTTGSNTNISQLGQALSFAAPLAASAKIELEETAAAIGVLSDAGLQASRAGTGLVGVIRQLSNITPVAKTSLEAYGLTAADVDIQTHGLATVLQTLRDANISTSDAFKIFGSEAGAAAQILFAGADRVREFTGELDDAEGAASVMAKTLGSGLAGSWAGFNSAVSESIISLGRDQGVAGGFQAVVDTATGVISVYNGMLPQFAEANDLNREQAQRLQTIANVLGVIGPVAGGAAAGFIAYRSAVGAATIAQVLFNRAVMANPLGLVITAAGLAVGAIYAYREELGLVDAVANNAANSIDSSSRAIREGSTAALDSSYETLVNSLEAVSLQAQDASLQIAELERRQKFYDRTHKGVADSVSGAIDQESAALDRLLERQAELQTAIEENRKARDLLNKPGSGSTPTGTPDDLIPPPRGGDDSGDRIAKSIRDEISALERAAKTWGMTADEVTLYTLATKGATDAQQLQAAEALRAVSALEAEAEAIKRNREEKEKLNQQALGIAEGLLTEEEAIIASYDRRRQIILDNTRFTGEAQTELLRRLENERNEQLIEANGSYWERWLQAAEENLTSFDELTGSVIEQFTRGFGDAFESAIFDAETFGDAFQGITESIARSFVNAVGQMIAQELALQAVKALTGEVAERSAIKEVAAIAMTKAAALAATAQTVAAQIAAAASTFAAWLPSAIAASIGSFGAAAAIGLAAVTAAVALDGFRDGGYTGRGGVNDIAGVVHGQEYVMDAASTARIGVDNLDAMRAGRALPGNVVPFPSTAPASSAVGPPIINVYEAENTSATVTTSQNEQGQDVIDIVVRNLLMDGEIAEAVGRVTGTQYQGA